MDSAPLIVNGSFPRPERPRVPANGAIPSTPDAMPDTISYDPATRRLHVGTGCIDGAPPEVWAYEVSGKQVLTQWFSYRGPPYTRRVSDSAGLNYDQCKKALMRMAADGLVISEDGRYALRP